MGSRLNQILIENMGNKNTKNEPENNGLIQNLNQATTEIKNTVEVNNNTVLIFLILIVVILCLGFLYKLYSAHMKNIKKKYTAPQPTV